MEERSVSTIIALVVNNSSDVKRNSRRVCSVSREDGGCINMLFQFSNRGQAPLVQVDANSAVIVLRRDGRS
jgi:hypothetical protein